MCVLNQINLINLAIKQKKIQAITQSLTTIIIEYCMKNYDFKFKEILRNFQSVFIT